VNLVEIKQLRARISARLGSGASANAEFLKMLEHEPDILPMTVESYTKVKMYWRLVLGLLNKMDMI
jgi:hypothetical protein